VAVHKVNRFFCGICGSEKITANDEWFLLNESRWQDRLKILRWHDQLALQQGLHFACGPAHVQELVIHWMVTGSLDYPFARTSTAATSDKSLRSRVVQVAEVDTSAAEQIGELSVHRESIRRVLADSPQSLTSILDALHAAVDRKVPAAGGELELENEVMCLVGGD
jgi:hypothetical protein